MNLFMSSSVKEELASPNPGQKSFLRMLVGVNSALKLWLIILKSRFKIEKSSFYKNCSKESNLNYLFHNLSSQLKGKKDNQAVRFEFEFTSYSVYKGTVSKNYRMMTVIITLQLQKQGQEQWQ